MKRIAILLLAALPLIMSAQEKVPKEANRFPYHQYEYGDRTDTTVITVIRDGQRITILSPEPQGRKIQGYCHTVTTVDYEADSITVTAAYDDSSYYYRTALSRSDIEWRVDNGEWKTSINSNTLIFKMDDKAHVSVNPLPHYGLNKGVLREYYRNGQLRMKLLKAEKVKGVKSGMCKEERGRRVTPRELDRIMKERLVVTTRIFDHEQICWGKKNAHIDGGIRAIPADTVLHYAGGTLILKKVKLPRLPHHYQHFVEIHQQSNGDAYDRTGSLFIVTPGFFEGINQHPDSLPTFVGRDGQRYQGMISQTGYDAPLELVRFFTPFGVGHFNDRMKGYGIDWRDETYYRQEITDLYHFDDDVVIGAWIGNYDGGGHIVTVDIKSYPSTPATCSRWLVRTTVSSSPPTR